MNAETYNLVGKWITAAGLPSVLTVGLIGNALCFLVYSRKFFAKTSCGFYLRALSVSDIALNLTRFLTFIYQGLGTKIIDYSPAICKFYYFATFTTGPISAWIEALVSFDRAVHIVAPNKLQFLQKRRSLYLITGALVVIQSAFYIPSLYYLDLVTTVTYQNVSSPVNGTNGTGSLSKVTKYSQSCRSTSPMYIQVLVWHDLFNATICPFIVMLASSVAILVKTYTARRTVSAQLQPEVLSQSRALKIIASDRHNKREQRDLKFALTIVSLCFLFFVLNIGKTVFFLLNFYRLVPSELYQMLSSSFVLMSVADFSLKFFLYLLVNTHFRSEFTSMLKSSIHGIDSTSGYSNKHFGSRDIIGYIKTTSRLHAAE